MSRRTLPFFAALFSLLSPLPLAAQTPPPTSEKTISMDFANADLHAVVSMLEHQAQVKALVQDGNLPFQPVNVHLVATTLTRAIRVIALSAGASVTRDADGVYVFTPADGPASPPSSHPGLSQVQIQVAFVATSLADMDKMGLQFETIPGTALNVGQAPLKVAHGEAVAQVYHTLNRTHTQVIQAPMIVTNNKTTASISVETQTPKASSPLTSFFRLHMALTITPRMNDDGSVTLGIQVPNSVNGDGESNPSMSFPLFMRTVPSGETMVISSPLTDKPLAGQNLLIFLTPTVIAGSSAGGSQ